MSDALTQHMARQEKNLSDLINALAGLEEANDVVCAGRSQAAYDQMLRDGQADALLALDEARRDARELLDRMLNRS